MTPFMYENAKKSNFIAVVVPVYKNTMTAFEKISLRQCIRVLYQYDIYLLAPESLNVSEYIFFYNFKTKRFSDSYFKSKENYSELLLSQDFYLSFRNYDYLLIHQLDAFVFSDKLEHFCSLGYDYIGAPIPMATAWPHEVKRVGNGGLSLRKVSGCLKVLSAISPDCVYSKLSKDVGHAEDVYFAWCGGQSRFNFRTPTVAEALEFSIENNVARCYRKLGDWLPFGCHAWIIRLGVWWPIIKSHGYKLPDEKPPLQIKDNVWVQKYIMKRLLRKSSIFAVEVMKRVLFRSEYSIWGYGKIGKKCLQILNRIGCDIKYVYDESLSSKDEDVEITKPVMAEIAKRKEVVIITTERFGEEIGKYFTAFERREWYDYLYWSKIMNVFLQQYSSILANRSKKIINA